MSTWLPEPDDAPSTTFEKMVGTDIECDATTYFVSALVPPMTACAAESRAMGTLNGEQLT